MKKPDHKSREAKAVQLRSVLDENADLFEVRFLNQSTSCVEWFEDVKDALCRFVVMSSTFSSKELQDKLTDTKVLKTVVLDELRGHGIVDEAEIDAIGARSVAVIFDSYPFRNKFASCAVCW